VCVRASGVSMLSYSGIRVFSLGLVLATAFTAQDAIASERLIYSFHPGSKQHPDGGCPMGGLIAVDNVLYGTAYDTGATLKRGYGAIFGVTRGGAETSLYIFQGNSDGANPSTGLVHTHDQFFGTTESTLFSATVGNGGSITETPLHQFGASGDGSDPGGTLIESGGVLYGVAEGGGSESDGAAFTANLAGSEQVLYSFGTQRSDDGEFPMGNLVRVGGDFYGVAYNGGRHGEGAVFRVSRAGREYLVYSFEGGADGALPVGGLVDYGGVLYGVTSEGGANNEGTLFSVSTDGAETVLHSFGGTVNGEPDGQSPQAAPIVVGDTLYGTTAHGGAPFAGGGAEGLGTVYSYSPAQPQYSVVYSFGTNGGYGDADEPFAPLLLNGDKLYGTTCYGGAHSSGTVFVIDLRK
jgi:uncharacterized repeat protein (TIGR03803 family)